MAPKTRIASVSSPKSQLGSKATSLKTKGDGTKKKKKKEGKQKRSPEASGNAVLFREIDRVKVHEFDNVWAVKEVLSGKIIDFDYMNASGFGFDAWFSALGWKSLMIKHEEVYPVLVRQFYFSLSAEYKDSEIVSLSAIVNRVSIKFDAELLGEILGVPLDGLETVIKKQWPNDVDGFNLKTVTSLIFEAPHIPDMLANLLPVEKRLLHLFVCNVLIPKKGRLDRVSILEALIMWCLMTGTRYNLPVLIMRHMENASSRVNATLPYGFMLTKIFKYFHVPLDNQVKAKKKDTDVYDEKSLHRMMFRPDAEGNWVYQVKDGYFDKNAYWKSLKEGKSVKGKKKMGETSTSNKDANEHVGGIDDNVNVQAEILQNMAEEMRKRTENVEQRAADLEKDATYVYATPPPPNYPILMLPSTVPVTIKEELKAIRHEVSQFKDHFALMQGQFDGMMSTLKDVVSKSTIAHNHLNELLAGLIYQVHRDKGPDQSFPGNHPPPFHESQPPKHKASTSGPKPKANPSSSSHKSKAKSSTTPEHINVDSASDKEDPPQENPFYAERTRYNRAAKKTPGYG